MAILRFIEKNELFAFMDDPDLLSLPPHRTWHLKSVQDLVAARLLLDAGAKKVVEVGAGNSRVLPFLADRGVECWAVDPVDGNYGGPATAEDQPGVNRVQATIGDSGPWRESLEGADAVFSISVIEHISTPELTDFLGECGSLVRPGGCEFHLVDAYLGETPAESDARRLQVIADYLTKSDGVRCEAPVPVFHTNFASNPDNTMHLWNQSAPKLARVRAEKQACTYLAMSIR